MPVAGTRDVGASLVALVVVPYFIAAVIFFVLWRRKPQRGRFRLPMDGVDGQQVGAPGMPGRGAHGDRDPLVDGAYLAGGASGGAGPSRRKGGFPGG